LRAASPLALQCIVAPLLSFYPGRLTGSFIISGATRARLRKAHEIRPLGEIVVKGKTRPVEIFQVVVPSPLPEKEAKA